MTTPPLTPMNVVGVQHLVERAYRESGELQYLRELYFNAVQAGATRVEFGPEWRAVERTSVYRLMVADNGKGMDPNELLKFLNTFGGGGKPIGDAHENFGVGAKTSLLPWNRAGLVVLSWTAAHPEGAMVWLRHDPKTGQYGAQKFETPSGDYHEVVEPFGEWADVKPDWLVGSGTVVICIGNTGCEDTFLGKTSDGEIKAIAAYLNKRLWAIPDGVSVHVQELRTQKRNEWPRSFAEASGGASEPDRRWNHRRIRGAKYFVTETDGANGKLGDTGSLELKDGTRIDWYLWSGDRPKVNAYAQEKGYVAAIYKDEVYDTQKHASQFRSFGITHSAVRENLTLVAWPPLAAKDGYGVYPDTARNALKIRGDKRAGESLPWPEWAQEFAQNLPDAIADALAKAGPASSGTLEDSKWKERLADRFAARWQTLRYAASPKGVHRINPDLPRSAANGNNSGDGSSQGGAFPGVVGSGVKPVSARKPSPAGAIEASEAQTRGGLPDYQWTTLAEINDEGAVAYAAAWTPPTKDKPHGVVQIARDFRAIAEVRKFWLSQYPAHLETQISAIIDAVYGEVMVARVAHSQQFVSDPSWGQSRVDAELRSQAALTMAILGLVSEDQAISARVSGLGVRRASRTA